MKLLLPLLLIGSAVSFHANGQSVTAAAGQSATAANLSVDWTIGEPITFSATLPGVQLTQGFQQPAMQVTSIEPLAEAAPEGIHIFPNPVSDILNIELQQQRASAFTLMLTDMQGRQMEIAPVAGLSAGTSQVDMSALPAGAYRLHVLGSRQASFIIIKKK